jgi:branched-chain amino acid transport system ATP-binding protein
MEEDRHRMAAELNLIEKKKLMMGAALGTRPMILMLDEPMAGSNAHEIRDLMVLIRKINEDMGVTILIIEHFMKVLTELTEKLLIIESGTRIAEGDPEMVTRHPVVIECYLGEAYAENN